MNLIDYSMMDLEKDFRKMSKVLEIVEVEANKNSVYICGLKRCDHGF